MNRVPFTRLLPAATSLLIHVGFVATIAAATAWAPARLPVLVAELVVPDEPPARSSRPDVKADPRPVTPPRPIAAPRPAPPATPPPEPAPQPVVPEPRPAPVEPARSPAAAPAAPSPAPAAPAPAAASTPSESESGGAFALPAPAADNRATSTTSSSAPDTALAAVPADGITQRAIPRGGYQHLPAYPSSARRLGIQGTTLLQVLVSEDGRVAEVLVKQSAGHSDLDQAAVNAVRRWRFEPARRGTEAVAMWVQIPFEFRFR